MKNIFRINVVLLLLFFSCKENKNNSEFDLSKIENKQNIINDKDSISSVNKNLESSKTFQINLDTLKVSNLPIGYPNLFKKNLCDKNNNFNTNIEDGTPYEPYISVVKIKIKSNNPINKFIESNQSFYYDFNNGLLINNSEIEKKSLKYFQYVGRIPDCNNFKILLLKQEGLTYKSNEYSTNVEEMYEIAVFDKMNKFQSSINIASVGSVEFNKNIKLPNKRFYKVFLIEHSSEIKIKYIETFGEETKSTVLYETKYRITETGSLVQWFNQENGIFKNDFEMGELKNHLKVGEWSEFSKKNSQEVTIFYNNGIPQKDDIDFYKREKFDGVYKRFGPEHQVKNGVLVK